MTGSPICPTPGRQRLLFLMAGTMTLISVVLTLLVDSRWLLAAFVAINPHVCGVRSRRPH